MFQFPADVNGHKGDPVNILAKMDIYLARSYEGFPDELNTLVNSKGV